ncbi:MAG TPA: class I SAM-dependent methyltransferase [Streptosporangiaceae bacterium]|nr:class I SAM-dependent methyltransferase [Streptosporangiaceae bacterium]
MDDAATGYRLYADLAPWWPLISPPGAYIEESATARRLLRSAAIPVHEVLELGSGGGHNAVHLKQAFDMTLVDLSPDMLAVSRQLNRECVHVEGDMRTVRLGRTFDAVFVHDAVDYMLTEDDLRLAIATAYAHCRPGGVAVFVPDFTAESFEPVNEHGGSDDKTGRGAHFEAWLSDPDPGDTMILAQYRFVLQDADGSTRVIRESHRTGLFSRDTWLDLLTRAGFAPGAAEQSTEGRPPREIFVAHRRQAGRRPVDH